jgi:vitamin B12/bleomycin/antimicrobial peptide transport system ATP-binding/permease protein
MPNMTIKNLVRVLMSSSKMLLARRIYNVTTPYFLGPQWGAASIGLAKTLLLLWAYIYVNVQVSYALKFFNDAFENRQVHDSWRLAAYYALWLLLMVPLFVNYGYYRSMLALKWRRFMTPYLIELVTKNHTLHRMNSDVSVDNLEQRITQNVKDYSLQAAGLFFVIVEGVTNLAFFTPTLWHLSHKLTYLAYGYPAVGSVIAVLIARKLVALAARQDKLEADLRLEIGEVRQHALSIALLKGEVRERQLLGQSFDTVAANFERIVVINRRLGYFTAAYNYMVPLIPFCLLSQSYFDAELTWGSVAQAGYVYAQMYNSSALIVSQFGNFSDFASTVKRLGSFMEGLFKHVVGVPAGTGIQIVDCKHFGLENLTVLVPGSDAKLLREPVSINIANGSSLAIVSPAEEGSMLLRAIAGVEQAGSGTVNLPAGDSVIFLPQPPYVPTGTLLQALAYPGEGEQLTQVQMRKWLKLFKLEDLEAKYGFDTKVNWLNELRVDDQQRLSLARLMLAKPKYVFLDEPTRGLETDAEQIFTLLKSLDATIVTATHLPDMVRQHDYVLELPGDGSWKFDSTAQRTLALAH